MARGIDLIAALAVGVALCVGPLERARAFDLAIDAKLPPSQAVAVPAPPTQIDEAVTRLDELAAAIMTKSGIPGMSVAVVRGGKVVYAKGSAYASWAKTARSMPTPCFSLPRCRSRSAPAWSPRRSARAW